LLTVCVRDVYFIGKSLNSISLVGFYDSSKQHAKAATKAMPYSSGGNFTDRTQRQNMTEIQQKMFAEMQDKTAFKNPYNLAQNI
jgi:hypothetical protein